jgi:hypothetical protein
MLTFIEKELWISLQPQGFTRIEQIVCFSGTEMFLYPSGFTGAPWSEKQDRAAGFR